MWRVVVYGLLFDACCLLCFVWLRCAGRRGLLLVGCCVFVVRRMLLFSCCFWFAVLGCCALYVVRNRPLSDGAARLRLFVVCLLLLIAVWRRVLFVVVCLLRVV